MENLPFYAFPGHFDLRRAFPLRGRGGACPAETAGQAGGKIDDRAIHGAAGLQSQLQGLGHQILWRLEDVLQHREQPPGEAVFAAEGFPHEVVHDEPV